jgi:hypothetical protein
MTIGIIEVPGPQRTGHNRGHSSSHWPLTDLRLQTPELELRWPSLDDLDALADLAAAGVHDPEVQPFMVAWTDASPEERARSTLQYTGPAGAPGRPRTGCWSSP